MIDYLYRADLELARRVVMSAQVGARLRSRRAQLSLAHRADGRSRLRRLLRGARDLSLSRSSDGAIDEDPPSSRRRRRRRACRCQLARRSTTGGFFARALATLSRRRGNRTTTGPVVGAHEPGHGRGPGGARRSEARSVPDSDRGRLLSVSGLEPICRAKIRPTGQALESVALERIFRVGFSLTCSSAELAETLCEEGLRPARPPLGRAAPRSAPLRASSLGSGGGLGPSRLLRRSPSIRARRSRARRGGLEDRPGGARARGGEAIELRGGDGGHARTRFVSARSCAPPLPTTLLGPRASACPLSSAARSRAIGESSRTDQLPPEIERALALGARRAQLSETSSNLLARRISARGLPRPAGVTTCVIAIAG